MHLAVEGGAAIGACVPLTEPLLVFIQVGGVQGLPQKRMLPFTACAALT